MSDFQKVKGEQKSRPRDTGLQHDDFEQIHLPVAEKEVPREVGIVGPLGTYSEYRCYEVSSNPTGQRKADGTPDMRFKANRAFSASNNSGDAARKKEAAASASAQS